MRCNPAHLSAFVDSELRGVQAWRLRRHLAHCPTCQAELAELTALAGLVGAASPLPARPPIRRPIGLVRPAAALLAATCAVGFLMQSRPEPTPPAPLFVAQAPPPEPVKLTEPTKPVKSATPTKPAERRPLNAVAKRMTIENGASPAVKSMSIGLSADSSK